MEGICWKKVSFIILLLSFLFYVIVLIKQPILLDKFFFKAGKENRLFNRCKGELIRPIHSSLIGKIVIHTWLIDHYL